MSDDPYVVIWPASSPTNSWWDAVMSTARHPPRSTAIPPASADENKDPMTPATHLDQDGLAVTPLVRAAAQWSWRLLAIGATVTAVAWAGLRYADVVLPVALAILGCALLAPVVEWLDRHACPRALAVAATITVAIAAVVGITIFVVEQFVAGLPALTAQATHTIDSVTRWLVSGPLGLDPEQLDHIGDSAISILQRHQSDITSGAIATATTLTQVATSTLLLLFLMIFFLHDGRRIWRFVTTVVPTSSREATRSAGAAGFATLVSYVRATVVVAAVDAIGIGVGLAVLGVPLALPLASLVFIGAFVPIIGALVTGALAVIVALVTQGGVTALIALAVVVAVQQVESHVLQPFPLGRSVQVHPVAVVLGIAAGTITAGIAGALLAVPLIAFLNTATRWILSDTRAEAVGDSDNVLTATHPKDDDPGPPPTISPRQD